MKDYMPEVYEHYNRGFWQVYDASDDEIDHDLSYNIGANEIAEGHFALFLALLIGIITLGTRGKGKGLAAGLTGKGGNGMSGKLLQWGADHGKQLPLLQNMAKNSRTNASMFEDNAQRGYAAIPKKAGDTTGESVGQVKKDAAEKKPKIKSELQKPSNSGAWKNAPNPDKWVQNGGKFELTTKGEYKYTDSKGNYVIYDEAGNPNFSKYLTSTTGIKQLSIKATDPKNPSVGKINIEAMTGNRTHDNIQANASALNKLIEDNAGKESTPEFKNTLSQFGTEVEKSEKYPTGWKPNNSAPDGYVWHHVSGTTDQMQLVDSEIHSEFTHRGGASLIKSTQQ
jgi:hypothetical protein